MKEFLSRNGYTYDASNVDEDDGAYRALLSMGFRTIPVTIIAGRPIRGFDEPALREALARASAP